MPHNAKNIEEQMQIYGSETAIQISIFWLITTVVIVASMIVTPDLTTREFFALLVVELLFTLTMVAAWRGNVTERELFLHKTSPEGR